MNKSKIQKFAVDGHKLLYKQIAQRAYQYGIEEGNVGKADATEVRGRILSPLEKSQRAALIAEINANGYPQTIERVTYIWFNRIVALRFMEVNNYLPSHIRVFSDASGSFKNTNVESASFRVNRNALLDFESCTLVNPEFASSSASVGLRLDRCRVLVDKPCTFTSPSNMARIAISRSEISLGAGASPFIFAGGWNAQGVATQIDLVDVTFKEIGRASCRERV